MTDTATPTTSQDRDTLLTEIADVIDDYTRIWPTPYQLSANLILLTRAAALLAQHTNR